MPTPTLRIDFVSDVMCPWCAVGLHALEQAITRLDGKVDLDLHFQPFELNPQMPPEGQDIDEHIMEKYGVGPEQMAKNREAIRARGDELGFTFGERDRIHNTFDAHRLLHWAGTLGGDAQRRLKHALLRAYFTEGEDVSSHVVLARVAGEAGLDADEAAALLADGRYGDDVRAAQRQFASLGIRAVPSVILDGKHLVQGGQPVEVFERALRQVAGIG